MTTVQNVKDDELKLTCTKEAFDKMDDGIQAALDGDQHFVNVTDPDAIILEDIDNGLPEPVHTYLPDVNTLPGEDGYDKYIGAELLFDHGGGAGVRGAVLKQAKGDDGAVICKILRTIDRWIP